jgi:hypothetical protein
MMVLELVAIAHAVLTRNTAADCASPPALIFAGIVINFVLSTTTCSGLVHALQHANNSRKRSFLRASRPISAPVGASADTLLVEAFSVAALALDCFLLPYPMFSTPSGMIWLGPCCAFSHVAPQRRSTSASLRHLISGFVELAKCRGEYPTRG